MHHPEGSGVKRKKDMTTTPMASAAKINGDTPPEVIDVTGVVHSGGREITVVGLSSEVGSRTPGSETSPVGRADSGRRAGVPDDGDPGGGGLPTLAGALVIGGSGADQILVVEDDGHDNHESDADDQRQFRVIGHGCGLHNDGDARPSVAIAVSVGASMPNSLSFRLPNLVQFVHVSQVACRRSF